MPPTLSIIIPVHNRSVQICSLVRRFRDLIRVADAASEVEMIVVDDGSSERLSSQDLEGASLYRNAEMLGAPGARQRGFQHASGRFIHFHDSDDDVSDNWLTGILARTTDTPFDMLFTPRIVRTAGNAEGCLCQPKMLQHILSNPLRLRNYLTYENCIGPLGAVTFSRSAVERMSFPTLASCQDWHMYWEALHTDSVLIYVPHIWHVYEQSGSDRISSSGTRKRSGMDSACSLMSQTERKRILVQFFLKLGYDVKSLQNPGLMPRTLYSILRPAMLVLARYRLLDRVLFGPVSSP